MDELESLYREPCPWRIVDDAGSGFAIGAIGGGIFSFYKGIRFSSPGFSSRMRLGLGALKAGVRGQLRSMGRAIIFDRL